MKSTQTATARRSVVSTESVSIARYASQASNTWAPSATSAMSVAPTAVIANSNPQFATDIRFAETLVLSSGTVPTFKAQAPPTKILNAACSTDAFKDQSAFRTFNLHVKTQTNAMRSRLVSTTSVSPMVLPKLLSSSGWSSCSYP